MFSLVFRVVGTVSIGFTRILEAARFELAMYARVFALAKTRGYVLIACVQLANTIVFTWVGITSVFVRLAHHKARFDEENKQNSVNDKLHFGTGVFPIYEIELRKFVLMF